MFPLITSWTKAVGLATDVQRSLDSLEVIGVDCCRIKEL